MSSKKRPIQEYIKAIDRLKEVLDEQGPPYLGIGIAGCRLLVSVKLKEYSDQLPSEIYGIPVSATVIGQTRDEWPYGR